MKKAYYLASMAVIALFSALAVSCSDDDDPDPTPEGTDPEVIYDGSVAISKGILFKSGTELGNGDQNFVFTGKETLKKGTYLLKGWVYVGDGAQLTIEKGTIIKGDKETKAALIVERGGKIFAEGAANEPIVFTSEQPAGQRKPGDWGGLIVCGKAKNNQGEAQIEGGPRSKHGGDNDDDNSGVLKYIRVEFAGYPFLTDKEINGVTLGSVGRGTTIDHIQVSYSNDDSFEWFGGSVNAKYLIAYKGWDDDFDTDNGFSGHVQFALAVRDPRIADVSQSNGFESDNAADGAAISPYTSAVFSNITLIGPATAQNVGFANTTGYINGGNVYPNNGSGLGKFQSAMQIRRSSQLACYNSVAVGFPIGLIIDGEKGNSVTYAKNNEIKLHNIFFAGMDVVGSDANKEYRDVLGTYSGGTLTIDETKRAYSSTFFESQTGNQVLTEAALKLGTGSWNVGQNYAPQSGSPLLGVASFTGVTSNFLDTTVTYAGAFSGPTDNWMDGWTNFDPQNTNY